MGQDISKDLQLQVKTCIEEKRPIAILGANSKHFYGNQLTTENLTMTGHKGIISYQPSELVLTARAGTSLSEISQTLKDNNQRLPFEPPNFAKSATLGGTIACGLSGASRPFQGSARDAVLGCKIINGHGEILRFGGEVVKNVAGYDVSRLMTGAMGTLGLLLETSIKVLPISPSQSTIVQEVMASKINDTMNHLRRSTIPISGLIYLNKTLYIRLNSTENAINAAKKRLGTEALDNDLLFWESINEHTHEFFQQQSNLWQILLPPGNDSMTDFNPSLIDWAGGLIWHYSEKPCNEIRNLAKKLNGYAVLFRRGKSHLTTTDTKNRFGTFPDLTPDMLFFQKNIKRAFDPDNIFNPGKMYTEI